MEAVPEMPDATNGMSDPQAAEHRKWFRETILPLEPRLRAYLRHLRRADANIDDLVHDSLIRALTHQNWRDVTSPWAFMRSVARNLLIDGLRRQKVVAMELTGEFDTGAFADDTPGPEASALARDELRRLGDAVGKLPPQQRKVFVMSRLQQLSIPEIAQKLGLSVSTIEKHLTRALRTCAEELGREAEGAGRQK